MMLKATTQKEVTLGAVAKSVATDDGFKARLQFVKLSYKDHRRELREVKCTLAIRNIIALFAFCFSHVRSLHELQVAAQMPRRRHIICC